MLPAVHNLLFHIISERHLSLSEHKNLPHTDRYHSYSLFFFFNHNAPRRQSFKNIFIPFPIFLAGEHTFFQNYCFQEHFCAVLCTLQKHPRDYCSMSKHLLSTKQNSITVLWFGGSLSLCLSSVIWHFLTILCFWLYLLFHLQ